jgi:hypothetical protein
MHCQHVDTPSSCQLHTQLYGTPARHHNPRGKGLTTDPPTHPPPHPHPCSAGMQPACQAYRAVLAQLHAAPYAVQAAAFWAIEACYNQAWAEVLQNGTAELYKEFAHRWV